MQLLVAKFVFVDDQSNADSAALNHDAVGVQVHTVQAAVRGQSPLFQQPVDGVVKQVETPEVIQVAVQVLAESHDHMRLTDVHHMVISVFDFDVPLVRKLADVGSLTDEQRVGAVAAVAATYLDGLLEHGYPAVRLLEAAVVFEGLAPTVHVFQRYLPHFFQGGPETVVDVASCDVELVFVDEAHGSSTWHWILVDVQHFDARLIFSATLNLD